MCTKVRLGSGVTKGPAVRKFRVPLLLQGGAKKSFSLRDTQYLGGGGILPLSGGGGGLTDNVTPLRLGRLYQIDSRARNMGRCWGGGGGDVLCINIAQTTETGVR